MPQSIINNGEAKMTKVVESYKKELATMKTGRANPAVVSKVTLNYYGVETPLNQIAAVSVPEAQILMIKPFDKSILKDLEKAILTADLNLTPQSDGTVIRLVFPPLTGETRKALVKQIKGTAEEVKVSIRNIRRDMNEELKELEKEGLITEDDLKKKLEDSQKLTDKYIVKIDEAAKEKEASVMEI